MKWQQSISNQMRVKKLLEARSKLTVQLKFDHTHIKVVLFIMDNGRVDLDMVKAKWFGLMALVMKVIGNSI
jgi:hypothetical protein